MTRVALVTGSNKGIGFEVVRQLCSAHPDWIVYLTARDTGRGEAAVGELKAKGLNPRFHQLDVDSIDSIRAFAAFLKKEHGGLDVLVNNAAIAFKQDSTAPFAEQARVTNLTNYFGFINCCNEFFPLLRDHARVVNVSSRVGHMVLPKLSPALQETIKACKTIKDVDNVINSFVKLAEEGKHEEAGWVNSAYGSSKIGVTAASYIQQRVLDEDKTRKDIVLNACCPGFVKTDMSSQKGHKEPEEGADTLVYLATLPENCESPRGRFVNERVINDLF